MTPRMAAARNKIAAPGVGPVATANRNGAGATGRNGDAAVK